MKRIINPQFPGVPFYDFGSIQNQVNSIMKTLEESEAVATDSGALSEQAMAPLENNDMAQDQPSVRLAGPLGSPDASGEPQAVYGLVAAAIRAVLAAAQRFGAAKVRELQAALEAYRERMGPIVNPERVYEIARNIGVFVGALNDNRNQADPICYLERSPRIEIIPAGTIPGVVQDLELRMCQYRCADGSTIKFPNLGMCQATWRRDQPFPVLPSQIKL